MYKTQRLGLAFLITLFVGCKGSGGVEGTGAGSCMMPAACGGDVVATWNVQDICLDDASGFVQQGIDEPECQDAFAEVEVDATGTMTFTADGMLTTDVSLAIGMHVVWTKPCLMALNPQLANLEIGSACTMLMSSTAMSDMFESAQCRVVGVNCECDVELVPRAMTSTGTYTLAGNQLIDEDSTPADYCVAGNTLTMTAMTEGV